MSDFDGGVRIVLAVLNFLGGVALWAVALIAVASGAQGMWWLIRHAVVHHYVCERSDDEDEDEELEPQPDPADRILDQVRG